MNGHGQSLSKMVATGLMFCLMVMALSAEGSIVISGDNNPNTLANAVTAAGGAGLTVISAARSGPTPAGVFSSGTFVLTSPPDTYGLTQGGIVLSTGNVTDYQTGPSTSTSRTFAYGTTETAAQKVLLDPITGVFVHRDVTQLDIIFNANSNTSNVFFNVVFGSEEYPEFVNSSFIDGFGLYLNGTNIAFQNAMPVNINHPCMAAVPGTELDGVLTDCGGTNRVVLLFSGTVVPGSVSNRLTFIVADTSDTQLDTTVYISALGGTPPPVVVVSMFPVAATNIVGQVHTVIACLTSNGVPLLNYPIDFVVSGANAGITATGATDTNGCAAFSYAGVNPGNDTITGIVIAGGTSNTATVAKTWLPPAVGSLQVTKQCAVFAPSNTVVFSGNVVNTGNVALSGVTVVDDHATPGDPSDDITFPVGVLFPGQTVPYSGQYLASTCGVFTNTVTATGFDSGTGNTVTATASASCEIPCPPVITCEIQFFNATDGSPITGNPCDEAGFGVASGTPVSVKVNLCNDGASPAPVSGCSYDLFVDGQFLGGCVFPAIILLPGECTNICTFVDNTVCAEGSVRTFVAQANCSDGAFTACTQTLECCPPVPTCPTCDGDVVVVDPPGVTINFNTNPPTYSGDPDLLPYFSYDKTGATPDTWKAIFDLGAKKLLVKAGATITTTQVPANTNNRRAPGIEIYSACELEVEQGGYITVGSLNRQAGNILIEVDGNITVNGVVSNTVAGTNGRPGDIRIGSKCGTIYTGPTSKIITYGQDFGGSDINIATCESGDVQIYGLVDASYKAKQASTIRIASFGGEVLIDGWTNLGQEVVAGTRRTITSGVSVRSRRDPLPGAILLQAQSRLIVNGSKLLSTQYPNYGAVAVKTASNSSKGGLIDARCLAGDITAIDRAFDNANRFNTSARINLEAASDIGLFGVVSVQGGDTGQGGINSLRAFNGGMYLADGSQLLADWSGRPGSNGANLLTSCLPIAQIGATVSPADANPVDDNGVCGGGPDPLFLDCTELGLTF